MSRRNFFEKFEKSPKVFESRADIYYRDDISILILSSINY